MLAASQAYELCIGQDYWSIMNYTAVMGKPACVMSYASLYNLTAAIYNGTEYGSGVEHASRLLQSLPYADLPPWGSWLASTALQGAGGAGGGADGLPASPSFAEKLDQIIWVGSPRDFSPPK